MILSRKTIQSSNICFYVHSLDNKFLFIQMLWTSLFFILQRTFNRTFSLINEVYRNEIKLGYFTERVFFNKLTQINFCSEILAIEKLFPHFDNSSLSFNNFAELWSLTIWKEHCTLAFCVKKFYIKNLELNRFFIAQICSFQKRLKYPISVNISFHDLSFQCSIFLKCKC